MQHLHLHHHHHHHHRDASPVQLEDLPESFHAVNVSPPASTGGPLPGGRPGEATLSASASTSRSSSVIGVKRDASVSVDCRKDEEDEAEQQPHGEQSRGRADRKGKGRAINSDNDNDNGDTSMDECDAAFPAGSVLPGAGVSSNNSSAGGQVHRPHHPQNHDSLSTSGANVSFGPGGFGVKGPPGGDCKRICLRHQRMVDGGARVDLQKQLEKFPEVDQQTANTIWSLFSSSSGAARLLTLRGLLTICCPSQLSFLSEKLKAECRLDPFAVLPREIALKCMTFLDAVSLGRAAQVSKSWKALADDDLLWRTMCEQHIERKCEKCGWGLPLLEKKRKQKQRDASSSSSSSSRDASRFGRVATSSTAVAGAAPDTATDGSMPSTSTAQALARYENSQHNHTPLPKSLEEALAQAVGPRGAPQSAAPTKRPRLAQSASNMQLADLTLVSAPPSPKYGPPLPEEDTRSQQQHGQSQAQAQAHAQLQLQAQARAQAQTTRQAPTRPWKSVYCERLAIARNWARGKCSYKTLKGHTDAITCLQIDDSLHDVPYPVLMTGSWDRTVRIWNAETGMCVSELRGHTRGVRCIQFDSAKLISGGMDSTLKIWSWRTGQCIRTLEGHRDSVISLCFDKHVLASGSADSTIKVWNFNTAECFTLRGHREWVNQVRIWSPESTDCSVTPANLAEPGGGGSAAQPSSAPMPAVKLLFSASDDGTIKLWDLVTRQCLRTLEGHVAQVQCLKIISVTDQSANQFPVANEDSGNSFINPSEQSSLSSAEAAAAAAAARNRSQVVAGNGYAGFFDAQQAAPGTGLVPASQLPIAAPSASAFLAAAARPPPDPSTLPFIDFGTSPAPLIVSGSLDNTIKLWNIDDAKCARTLFGHIEGVWDVDMDQLRIVSASHDRTIKIWDRNSGKCLHTLVGHRGAVTSLALGDDKIISGSDDCTVRIWSFAKQ